MKKALFLLVIAASAITAHAQSTTTNLTIQKPNVGTPPPQANNTIAVGFDAFDAAVAGRLSKSVAGSSNVTLTTTEARNAILEFTGTLTGNINVIVPTKTRKYLVYNGTAGSFTLTVKTASGTGVAVAQGGRGLLYCDGTNVVSVGSSLFTESGLAATLAGRLIVNLPSGAPTDLLTLRYSSATKFNVDTNGGITFADGVRQAFAPSATTPSLNVGTISGDPSSPVNGDVVYNSTSNKFRCYQNGAWTDCIGSGGGGVSDGDKGDITVSGSGATWTIDNTAVTFGKIQNVTDNRLLGRSAGSSGAMQEITVGSGLSLSGGTLTASGGAGAWSGLTNPSGNLSLAMGANLTTLTWGSNFGSSSAFKLTGADTTATGPLLHVTTGVSNNITPVLVEPRGGQAFKITELGNVVLGAPSPISSTTTGFPYVPVIQSNAEPSGTPTSITGAAPIVFEQDAIFAEYRLWAYLNGAWRNLTPTGGMFATQSGTGAQAINWSTSYEAVSTRQITMTGNVTLSFTAPQRAGTMCVLITVQDATGGRTITWPSSVKWPGGSAGTPTNAANAKDTWTFVYDGTNYQYIINANDVK